MILPTKHIPTEQSLVGLGALVLQNLKEELTLSELWDRLQGIPEVGTFHRLVLTLDVLYTIGAVRLENGLLRRVSS